MKVGKSSFLVIAIACILCAAAWFPGCSCMLNGNDSYLNLFRKITKEWSSSVFISINPKLIKKYSIEIFAGQSTPQAVLLKQILSGSVGSLSNADRWIEELGGIRCSSPLLEESRKDLYEALTIERNLAGEYQRLVSKSKGKASTGKVEDTLDGIIERAGQVEVQLEKAKSLVEKYKETSGKDS